MGNEHFWQVPRAKGVYARSMHGRERSSWGRYQRTPRAVALPTRRGPH